MAACSQGPNFAGKCKISAKTLDSDGTAIYNLTIDNDGVRGIGSGTVAFKAPVSFADVGDYIMFIDGALKPVRVDK